MDSVGSISNSDVVVVSNYDDLNEIRLIDYPQGTYIKFKETASNTTIFATNNSAIGGAGVTAATLSLSKNAGELNFQIRQSTIANSTVTATDSTQTKIKIISSESSESLFTLGNKNDSISFAGNSRLNNSRIDMNSGNDTIQFSGRSVISGENNITLGAGRDTVSIDKNVKLANNASSLIIKDFDKDDTLRIGNRNYNLNDIANGGVRYAELSRDGSVHIGMSQD